MNKLKISALVLCMTAAIGCAQDNVVVRQDPKPGPRTNRGAPKHGQGVYAEISVVKVKEKMDKGEDITILDVRSEKEFQGGHLKNAVHIPISELMSRYEELNKEKETIVYCHSGFRSRTGGNILVSKGFTKVRNMAAGISGWKYEVIK